MSLRVQCPKRKAIISFVSHCGSRYLQAQTNLPYFQIMIQCTCTTIGGLDKVLMEQTNVINRIVFNERDVGSSQSEFAQMISKIFRMQLTRIEKIIISLCTGPIQTIKKSSIMIILEIVKQLMELS